MRHAPIWLQLRLAPGGVVHLRKQLRWTVSTGHIGLTCFELPPQVDTLTTKTPLQFTGGREVQNGKAWPQLHHKLGDSTAGKARPM